LTPLKTLVGDYQGYLVEIEKDELIDTISGAIAEKIPAVIRCFEKGATDAKLEGVSG
jgi:hypothetical protein